MADSFFALSRDDQHEVLLAAGVRANRPTYLLEKDVWVVWTLRTLYASPHGALLTFKGGTSLSKAWRVIQRFSEDIDLTYDIRHLLSDLVGDSELPASRSQKDKWTRVARERLPGWIEAEAIPLIRKALADDGLDASLTIGGNERDSLLLEYPPLHMGPAYVQPVVKMEFGGRATGEPRAIMQIQCDAESLVPSISFPTASPVVMGIARTFWEKATAAHVYCAQQRIRGERYARHWHDLAAISRSTYFHTILEDHAVAAAVAEHKAWFFQEKDTYGSIIDYKLAAQGQLRLVPEGKALQALATDYAQMREAGVLLDDALSFEELMQSCAQIEERINRAAGM